MINLDIVKKILQSHYCTNYTIILMMQCFI